MHLELVELLRCPVVHAPSVLVASADVITDRYITEGILGCPECYAEYAVRSGVTSFGDSALAEKRSAAETRDDEGEISAAMRLAAQLGLIPGRTVYALVGYDLATIIEMRAIVAARVLAFNTRLQGALSMLRDLNAALAHAPLGIARIGGVLPVVASKFDGIAIESELSSPELLKQAVTALRAGGRLVADVSAPLPAGVGELVRDDRVWVAEKSAEVSAPVQLRRG